MAELYSRVLDNYYGDLGSLEADLSSDVALHEENVQDDAMKLSSIYSKWRCLKAIAESRYRSQKRLVKETVWPAACLAASKRAQDSGMKTPQYQIEWSALQDPAYASAAEALNKFGLVLDMLKGVVDTLWLKKDMIQTNGFGDRREKNSVPKIQNIEEPWSPKNLGLTEEEMEQAARDKIAKSKNIQ